MSGTEALRLEDPDGSVMLVQRVEGLGLVFSIQAAEGSPGFRMFEDDREKLTQIMRPLDG